MERLRRHGFVMISCRLPPLLDNCADSHFSRDHRYVTSKVHINALTSNRELEIYQYLKGVESDHPGREMIRMLEDSFKLQGPYGTHEIFVLPPLGLSLRAFQDIKPGHIFAQPIVVIALQRVLAALDFLHGPANLTHTGKTILIELCFLYPSCLNLKQRCPCGQSPHQYRRYVAACRI